jgi:hypothetical protein
MEHDTQTTSAQSDDTYATDMLSDMTTANCSLYGTA